MDTAKIYVSILFIWFLIIVYRLLPSKLEKFTMKREDAHALIVGISGGAYIAVISSLASMAGILLHGSINGIDSIEIMRSRDFLQVAISFALSLYFAIITLKALCKDKTA